MHTGTSGRCRCRGFLSVTAAAEHAQPPPPALIPITRNEIAWLLEPLIAGPAHDLRTGSAGPRGGAATSTTPGPAITSGKPPTTHEGYDLRLEYYAASAHGTGDLACRWVLVRNAAPGIASRTSVFIFRQRTCQLNTPLCPSLVQVSSDEKLELPGMRTPGVHFLFISWLRGGTCWCGADLPGCRRRATRCRIDGDFAVISI